MQLIYKYLYLNNFFSSFLVAVELGKYINDEKVIEEFIQESSTEVILSTLNEGKELMELVPFPVDFINTLTCLAMYDEDGNFSMEPEVYIKWVKKTLYYLEDEARRQGKL